MFFSGTTFICLIFFVYEAISLQCDSDTEEVKKCGINCELICSNFLQKNRTCSTNCQSTECGCKESFVRNENGSCVSPAQCSDAELERNCETNEELNKCGDQCEATCDYGLTNGRPCPHSCDGPPACTCKKGFARNSDNTCIKTDECHASKPLKCGDTQTVSYCGCQLTCQNLLQRFNSCSAGRCQKPSCICSNNFVLNSNGTCVPVSECSLQEFKCATNERLIKCDDICEFRCSDFKRHCEYSPYKHACVCKHGFGRRNSVCVPMKDC